MIILFSNKHSADPDQSAHRGADSTRFAIILLHLLNGGRVRVVRSGNHKAVLSFCLTVYQPRDTEQRLDVLSMMKSWQPLLTSKYTTTSSKKYQSTTYILNEK